MSSTITDGSGYSLRQRLLLGITAGFIVILTIISIGLFSYAHNASNQSFDRLLIGSSLAILERIYGSTSGPIVDIPYSALEMAGLARDDRVFYRVSTHLKQTLTGNENLPLPKNYQPNGEPQLYDAFYSGEWMRFIVQSRLITGPKTSTWVVVQLGHTRLARDKMEQDLIVKGLGILVLVAIIGLVCVWYGINIALRPLVGIEHHLRSRDPDNLTPLPLVRPREIEALVLSINGLFQRLKTNLENSQTFIADVAHQTRTSLGALLAQIELASGHSDPKEMQRRVAKANTQAHKTIRLTNQLLSHAMVNHRAEQLIQKQVHLLPLVRELMSEALKNNVTTQIEFELIDDNIKDSEDLILGDSMSLREALCNLIDNAIKHGPQQNKINIHVINANSHVRLLIDDKGPGISRERREVVLQRFTSFDASGKGSGLGLSIVQAVVKTHGGELTLEESPSGGLRVRIDFLRVGA
jgi:two-component system, OmpR family, sensor histidine kinase TctE